MARRMTHHVSRNFTAKRLVVVPNLDFGSLADESGMIDDDEFWVTVHELDRTRGKRLQSWRYLDTLDRPPAPGSSRDVMEAWLERDERPFPPLDSATRFQLDALVMFVMP